MPSNSRMKTSAIACAAAAATSLLPATVTAGHAPSDLSGVHATLWGNHDEWTDTALNIPRGGTGPPAHDRQDETTTKKSRPKSGNSKKKKKKKSKKETTSQDDDDGDDDDGINHTRNSNSNKNFSKRREEEEAPPKPKSPPNPMMKEILEKDDYYDILGLPRGESNHASIKKAYRRRAIKTHPDKTGGDRRAFDKLAEAYDVLLDDDKRALYDRFGKEGLDPTFSGGPGTNFGMGAEDLFRSFFNGMGGPFSQGPGRPQSERRPNINRTLRYQLDVTLEELYQGKTRQVTVEAPSPRNLYFAPPEEPRKKTVQVNIPRGAQPGQSVVLSGEMDFDSLDSPPGDLMFSLQPRPHKIFTRKGHDLALKLQISLQEAIAGCTRTIQHLDGRSFVIESAKTMETATTATTPAPEKQTPMDTVVDTTDAEDVNATITKPTIPPTPPSPLNVYIRTGDVQVLKGKGMPKNPQGTEFGDLYIQYVVELPRKGSANNLTREERAELARLLEKLEGQPPQNRPVRGTLQKASKKFGLSQNNEHQKQYTLEPAKLSDFGRASGPVPQPQGHDEHMHTDDDHHHQQQFHFPFGSGRQFFFSSSGRSPFYGQEENFDDDDPNVQCNQM